MSESEMLRGFKKIRKRIPNWDNYIWTQTNNLFDVIGYKDNVIVIKVNNDLSVADKNLLMRRFKERLLRVNLNDKRKRAIKVEE